MIFNSYSFENLDGKLKLFVAGFLFLLLEVMAYYSIPIVEASPSNSIIHVPVAWCAVNGSPAASNPNIPNPPGDNDTSTNDVLLRRLERVTDNIYLNQVGISFRSAINDTIHTSLDFPKFDDPNLTAGSQLGNISLTFNIGEEITNTRNACKDKWIDMSTGGQLNGIIVINSRLFVDNLGQTVATGGSSRCHSDLGQPCGYPYRGFTIIADNYYTYPSIISGQPPIYDQCVNAIRNFWNKDPLDQILAHEFGHSLGLNHNSAAGTLMKNCQEFNGPNGTINNIALNDLEKNRLREIALTVPGMKIDPPNTILQQHIVESNLADDIHENKNLSSFEDLAFLSIALDTNNNDIIIKQELSGIIPESEKYNDLNNLQFWTLVNADNDVVTGGNGTVLENLGVPLTNFSGADIVSQVQFKRNQQINHTTTHLIGNNWIIKNFNNNTNLFSSNFTKQPSLETTYFYIDHPFYTIHPKNKTLKPLEIPLYDTIRTTLNNSEQLIKLDRPLSLQSFVYSNGTIVDSLYTKEKQLILS